MGDDRLMEGNEFRTCQISPALAGAVRELWILSDDGSFHAGLPKPYVELVISLSGVHWWCSAPGVREHRYSVGWVTPVQRGPRFARANGRRILIGARLEPWTARALFGPLPPGDGSPPPHLNLLIGDTAERLRRWLIDAADDDQRFARLGIWLEQQLMLCGGAGDPITGFDCTSVADLARSLHTTPRSLRRRFAIEAGLSPKTWLKLHRLDGVLRDAGLSDARQSLATIATAHGYADQAHLSREMVSFTGATPGQLRRRPLQSPPHLLAQN